jgi:hypothetical protein
VFAVFGGAWPVTLRLQTQTDDVNLSAVFKKRGLSGWQQCLPEGPATSPSPEGKKKH